MDEGNSPRPPFLVLSCVAQTFLSVARGRSPRGLGRHTNQLLANCFVFLILIYKSFVMLILIEINLRKLLILLIHEGAGVPMKFRKEEVYSVASAGLIEYPEMTQLPSGSN